MLTECWFNVKFKTTLDRNFLLTWIQYHHHYPTKCETLIERCCNAGHRLRRWPSITGALGEHHVLVDPLTWPVEEPADRSSVARNVSTSSSVAEIQSLESTEKQVVLNGILLNDTRVVKKKEC